MAVIVGEAAVRLRPETSGFSEEAQVGVLGPLGDVAKKAAGLFAAAFAAEKVGEFLKDAVGEASDVSESTSKVGVVFGQASQQVLDFAKNSASAMGLSQAQALEATGTYGNLFRAIGLGSQQSATMSTSLTKLAGDLASFNNTDPTQALEALRSGLIGETEPLRQYGVNLNQAQIAQEAVRLGLAKQGAQLTTAQQAQAAYSLIMKQTALAQGDFARTSGGLANQTRIMSAQFDNVKANVGAALVPFVQLGALGITRGIMPPLLAVTSHLQAFGSGVTEVENSLVAAYNGIGVSADDLASTIGSKLGTALNNGQGLLYTFTDAAKGGGVGMLATEQSFAGSLARMGSEVHLFEQSAHAAWMSVAASVAPSLAPILPTVHGLVASLTASLGGIGGGGAGIGATLESGLSAVIGHLVPLMNAAIPVVTGVLQQIVGQVQAFLPILGDIFAQIGPIVSTVFSQVGPLIGQIVPVIMQVAGLWQHVLLGAFEQLLPVLPVIVQALGQLVTTLVGGLAPVFSQLAPVIAQVVTTLQGALVGAISSLIPVVPPLVSALTQVVGILGGALVSVLQALAPVIPVIVQVIGQLASIIAKGLGQALQTIVPVLPQIAELLGSVATMLAGALASALQAVLPILPPLVSALVQIANALIGALMGALQAVLPIIPQLVNLLLQLVQAAIVPLLPLLPMLAQLLSSIITALAPLLPVVIQVIALIIQLAISALLPLMPIIQTGIQLFVGIVGALMPIVQILLTVIGGFLRFGATIAGVVIGFVTRVIALLGGLVEWFVSLPMRILGAIGNFGTLLFSKGAELIQGLVNGIAHAASFVGDVAKNIVNALIGFINSHIIDGINGALDFTIAGIHINPPDIPHIPRLHEGGIFQSDSTSGEGLALLRDAELVATPEQQRLANDLLAQLLEGRTPVPGTTASGAAGAAPVQIVNNVTQQPGEDGSVLAARVTQGVVWNLNGGITRRVGVGAEATS